MKSSIRVLYGAAIAASVFALCCLSLPGAAHAQQPSAAAASQFAPVATPIIDPDALKTPQAAPDAEANKFKLDRSDKAAPAVTIPKRIDVGKYQLELDARHTKDVTAPSVAMDSGETSNLSKIAPGQKQEPILPNYFGLKLSTPTQ